MEHFDYLTVARQAAIPEASLHELCERIRSEFPHDDLLYELHVLRACIAIRDGLSRIEDVLASLPASSHVGPGATSHPGVP
jgi:hypothetical protein